MKRREILATAGVGLGSVAGCLDNLSDETGADEETPTNQNAPNFENTECGPVTQPLSERLTDATGDQLAEVFFGTGIVSDRLC